MNFLRKILGEFIIKIGLRPCIKRHYCTFGRRLHDVHSPEATVALCSPYTRILRLKMHFLRKILAYVHYL